MIRPATAADAAAVARVEIRARAHADELLDPDALEPPPRDGALVAELAGRVVGFVVPDGPDGLVLAVDPVAQGAGLGGTLLEAAGTDATHAWVPERDGLARAFLAGRGWSEQGESRQHDGAPERRMVPCAS